MNILIYTSKFLPKSETFIYNQGNSLKKYNNIMFCCTKRENSDIFPEDNISVISDIRRNIVFIINACLKRLKCYKLIPNKKLYYRIEKIIKDNNIDLVHVHFAHNLIPIYPILSKLKIPTVVTFHGYDASTLLKYKSYVKTLNKMLNCKNIYGITVSKTMKDELIKIGIDKSKLIPQYIGTDLKFFNSKNKKKLKNKIKLLQVSRLCEKKGHVYTLRAIRRYIDLYEDNIEFTIAGDGPLRKDIENEIKKLNLEKNVIMLGSVNKNEVKDLMSKTNIFVQHSITSVEGDKEGIPITLMEAMAMKIPVISTIHSGIPELVRDGKDGYLVKERDVEDFAKKIRLLVKNYNKMCIDTEFWLNENFNIYENNKKLNDIYNHIINKINKE
ncbi:glycosyltransferase [Clostridium perfringens]|uniref:glycosyltransferase n=2 Tax=Clostridium perfringens TaxID=1502 RepID=UPI0018E4A091|nr:glycosyltransferase [Clostridium perfringens]MBI6045817.1 glycosyltransferase [Clostridium perfringens]MDK0547016.1 glycosyltransferase [Clostridium perfringens]MDK0968740.1 glycosyltransferase [Clostridium perfringens]